MVIFNYSIPTELFPFFIFFMFPMSFRKLHLNFSFNYSNLLNGFIFILYYLPIYFLIKSIRFLFIPTHFLAVRIYFLIIPFFLLFLSCIYFLRFLHFPIFHFSSITTQVVIFPFGCNLALIMQIHIN